MLFYAARKIAARKVCFFQFLFVFCSIRLRWLPGQCGVICITARTERRSTGYDPGSEWTEKANGLPEAYRYYSLHKDKGAIMSLGALLLKLRKEKGISQKELASFLDVSIGTISNYENNIHEPDLDTLDRLARYYQVTTDYLLERTRFRQSLEIINQNIVDGYTVGDLINTTLELTNRNRNTLVTYMSMMKLWNQRTKDHHMKSNGQDLNQTETDS